MEQAQAAVCNALGIALESDIDTLPPLGCIPLRSWPWWMTEEEA
jgi:hypothetical protein